MGCSGIRKPTLPYSTPCRCRSKAVLIPAISIVKSITGAHLVYESLQYLLVGKICIIQKRKQKTSLKVQEGNKRERLTVGSLSFVKPSLRGRNILLLKLATVAKVKE
ncbi:Hypothetical predicted protein [Octopus vulgaris]|uniref:Uncharacterized protein n=1 Tax=Octopus vulgaris TaxID=6645 RepID=A0AA36BT57_OCTVU|nr:Hypothetical predicted protein [Octopus vulgaris]